MLKLAIKSDSLNIESDKQLVKSAIESEIKNLQRSLVKNNNILKEFQNKYQISSDFFLNNWTAENLERGDEEYITWLGEIKIKEKLIYSLEKLQTLR